MYEEDNLITDSTEIHFTRAFSSESNRFWLSIYASRHDFFLLYHLLNVAFCNVLGRRSAELAIGPGIGSATDVTDRVDLRDRSRSAFGSRSLRIITRPGIDIEDERTAIGNYGGSYPIQSNVPGLKHDASNHTGWRDKTRCQQSHTMPAITHERSHTMLEITL